MVVFSSKPLNLHFLVTFYVFTYIYEIEPEEGTRQI